MLRNLGFGCALALILAACGGDEEGSNGVDGTGGQAGPAGPAGPAGAAGAQGPAGPGSSSSGANPETPGVLSIVPAQVFPGRTFSLVISGNETDWQTTAPVVNLGPGIVVDDVTVGSATSLLVTAHTEPTAEFGLRSVDVGGLAFDGFAVASGLKFEPLYDKSGIHNGQVNILRVTSADPLLPLTTSGLPADALRVFLSGVDLAGDQVIAEPLSADSPTSMLIQTVTDIDTNGPFSLQFTTSLGSPPILPPTIHYGELPFERVEPEQIAAFPFATSMPATDFLSSRPFRFAAPIAGRYQCAATPPVGAPAGVSTTVFLTNGSGRFQDERKTVAQGDTVFFIASVQNNSITPLASVNFSIDCTSTPTTVVKETEPNDTKAQAAPMVAAVAYHGAIAGADHDFYAFTSDGSVNVQLNGGRVSSSFTMVFRNAADAVISTVTATPSANGAIAVPAGAATLDVFADTTLLIPQVGGEYELLFTP